MDPRRNNGPSHLILRGRPVPSSGMYRGCNDEFDSCLWFCSRTYGPINGALLTDKLAAILFKITLRKIYKEVSTLVRHNLRKRSDSPKIPRDRNANFHCLLTNFIRKILKLNQNNNYLRVNTAQPTHIKKSIAGERKVHFIHTHTDFIVFMNIKKT